MVNLGCRNTVRQDQGYSGIKGHSVVNQAMVDSQGICRHLHFTELAHHNDRGVFMQSQPYTDVNMFDGEQVVLGDNIYRGDGPILTTYNVKDLNRAANLDIRRQMVFDNAELKAARVIIENYFGRVRQWWHLVEQTWRTAKFKQGYAFRVACILTNRLMRLNNSYLRN
jgi:hypothetical protein